VAGILHDGLGLKSVLSLEDGSLSSIAIQWNEVTSVSAFKRDLFSYDLVCLIIRTGTVECELDEQMDRWESLIKALPKYLPGTPSPSEWWDKVAHPAFAPNMTILFSRREDPLR
jgi:hypothetical protein